MRLSRSAVQRMTRRTSGVVRVADLVTAGADRSWISRQVAAGVWRRPVAGVVVTHSGPEDWLTRAWVGLLHAGEGAALSHDSAAHALRIRPAPSMGVVLSVPAHRKVVAAPGTRVVRRRSMPMVTGGLPCVNRVDTLLDVVEQARRVDAVIAWLCDGARAGVWPEDVLAALATRSRFRNRTLVTELLGEVARGVESPMELRFGRDVERRHGLPRSVLQDRITVSGRSYRSDRWYERFGLRVELDGQLGHPAGRTDADTWRDNLVLLAREEITFRFRWRHVAAEPCRTAGLLAQALRRRGWLGQAQPCSPSCGIARSPSA